MLMKRGWHKQFGVTLPEMMIALGVNAILFIGLVGIFVSNLNHHRASIEEGRLNQQMQGAMSLMANDIRRAGYWLNANTDVGTDANTNPFMASGTDIAVNAGGDCILFTYDHDKNGSLAAISSAGDDEHYGFRLSGGAVQARLPGAAFNCTAVATTWENITDPSIVQISALVFTINQLTVFSGTGSAGLMIRSVDISMTGALSSDPTVTKTLTNHVRIRNDKYIE